MSARQVYFEHDNRGSNNKFRPEMGRRHTARKSFVAFTQTLNRSPKNRDKDVDMEAGQSSRFNPYGGPNNRRKQHNKGKPGQRPKHNQERFPFDNNEHNSWYKISIPYGRKAGKNFCLKALNSLSKVPIVPFNFQFSGNFAEFYINDHSAARHLRELSRKITTPDGFKMPVNVTRCPQPNASIDPETTELLKNFMSARYDSISHTLNLAKFHMDENMKASGLYLPLNRPLVLSTVAKIIRDHIPQLEALILTDNRLFTVDSLSVISSVCKQLKSVTLQSNKLRSMTELNSLKGLELTDLILDGNPLCDDFKNKAAYISAVRDRFPKLLRLDHHELPAAIGFDLGPETLPESKKSFFTPDQKDIVIQFLDQYYTVYDSGDRTKLLEAYHDQASFSLCLSKSTSSNKTNGSTIAAYNLDNRNLLKITDYSQRFKLLKQGKLSIVNALSELPQTMHDPTSFSVDIFHISPALLGFTVTGVFKEVGADINNATLKTFFRTFIVAPGLSIVNETLFIAHASQDQQAKAFKLPAPTPSPSPAPCEDKSLLEKQQLVIELAKQTGMNAEFSEKCLCDMDWDFQRAIATFMQFQSQGKLPPEAFVK